MPEAEKYDRDLQRLMCLGLDLNRPVDAVRPGRFPFLKNLRSYQGERIDPRPGLTKLGTNGIVISGATPVHSFRRLNDPLAADFTRIIGVGQSLSYGKVDPFTQVTYAGANVGFSGNPLALVPYRPKDSPRSWMYIADSAPTAAGAAAGTLATTLKKIRISGEMHQFGMPTPTTPLTNVVLSAPSYNFTVPDLDFEYTSNANLQAAWVAAGTAGAATLVARVNTTITAILYDTGTSGWACVRPASAAQMGRGVILNVGSQAISAVTNANPVEFTTTAAPTTGTKVYISGFTGGWVTANGSFTATRTSSTTFTIPIDSTAFGALAGTPVWGEMQVIQDMREVSTATTIGSVIYDAGSTGLCSVVLTTPVNQIDVDSMLLNSTLPEYVRVLSVTKGSDGTISLRCSTAGTFVAGNAVQLVASFRIYLSTTHAATETITAQGATTAVTVGSGTLTRTAAFDFSIIEAGVPVGPDDYIHISIRADVPSNISEGKLLFDVDLSTNDFTRNFYYKAFRSNDLTPSARNLQTLVATGPTVVAREIIDTSLTRGDSEFDPIILSPYQDIVEVPVNTTDSTSQQLDLGDTQWTELIFKISDLIRVGTDSTRTLANVASIRLLLTTTATVNFAIDDIWIGGGYGPDVVEPTGSPLIYRYRARSSQSGALSNASPPFRGGVSPYRQRVSITPPAYALAPASEADVLDIERLGGEIPTWHYIGTVPNDGTTAWIDEMSDDIVAGLPNLGDNHLQPWLTIGLPATGNTTAVSGTTVNGSGFSTSWAQGTVLQVNGVSCNLYRVISTTRLEVYQNLGNLGVVPWVIAEPELVSQPMPCLWMSAEDNVWMGCGDLTNPGRLYWLDPGSEGMKSKNWKDITSPSDPLMNGVHYNGRDYVWSTEKLFQILARRLSDGSFTYEPQEIPNGKGLFARWAITLIPGPEIQYLAKDGIYTTSGGPPRSLTDEYLYPLFPTETQAGTATNGVRAPNISSTNQERLRLNFCADFLYFDYLDASNNPGTLVFVPELDGWFYDEADRANVFHYGEEGQNVSAIMVGDASGGTGKVYQLAGNSDDGTAIACEGLTPSRDQGDARLNKYYGDIMIDSDCKGVSVTWTPGINNNATTYTPKVLSHTGRDQIAVPLGATWQTGRNISARFSFSIDSSSKPLLYIWEPRWTFESAPIKAIAWEISPSTLGMENFKHFGMVRITRISSVATPLIVTVDGIAQTAVNVPSSAGIYATYVFRLPVYKGKLFQLRIAPTDNLTEWRLDGRDSYMEVKEWGSDGPYHKMRVFSDFSMIEG